MSPFSLFPKLAAWQGPSVVDYKKYINDPKFKGGVTSKAELNQDFKPTDMTHIRDRAQQLLVGASPAEVDKATDDVMKLIPYQLDNREYGNQPYASPRNYDAINKERKRSGRLHAVPDVAYVFRPPRTNDGEEPVAAAVSSAGVQLHAANENAKTALFNVLRNSRSVQDSPQYFRGRDDYREAVIPPGKIEAVRNANISPEFAVELEKRLRGHGHVYSGFTSGYTPSARSTASHEVNHVNNSLAVDAERYHIQRQKERPNWAFSRQTYANKPAEAVQALATLKREGAAVGKDFSTPAAMAKGMEELLLRPENTPVTGELYRLRTYLQQAVKDFDRTYGNDPKIREQFPGYRPGQIQNHPVFKNITDQYSTEIPLLVRNQWGQPMSKIASAIAACRMRSL